MDVDEFFMQLFEQLETALKGTDEADLLKNLFHGLLNEVTILVLPASTPEHVW